MAACGQEEAALGPPARGPLLLGALLCGFGATALLLSGGTSPTASASDPLWQLSTTRRSGDAPFWSRLVTTSSSRRDGAAPLAVAASASSPPAKDGASSVDAASTPSPSPMVESETCTEFTHPDHCTAGALIAMLQRLQAGYDPLAFARQTFAEHGVLPLSFARALKYWAVPHASPEEAIQPAALAALRQSKSLAVAPLIPGDASTYVYKDEPTYLAMYASSWAAWTWRKCGWDCNRHLEIMAAGTVPLFNDSAGVARGVMFAYPLPLLRHIERHHVGASHRSLALWRHFTLTWGRDHLTAAALARYMFVAAGLEGAILADAPPPPALLPGGTGNGRVLFVDRSLASGVDYQSNFVLLGLVELLGPQRVDVLHMPAYMLPGTSSGARLYGGGFGLLHTLPHMTAPDWTAADRALSLGEYAAVVYGSYLRAQRRGTVSLWDTALRTYGTRAPHRLWLVDGEDIINSASGRGRAPWWETGGLHNKSRVFVRELDLDHMNDTAALLAAWPCRDKRRRRRRLSRRAWQSGRVLP